MANPFEIVATQLNAIGAFQYIFPFILVLAIFYALLRKSQILGDSKVINAVVSVSLAFMVVFGFPIATGFDISSPFAAFFMQVSVFILIFVVGMAMASVFYPNLNEWLPTAFKSRTFIFIGVSIAIAFFVTSGLVGILTTGLSGSEDKPSAPTDVLLISAGVIIFVIFIMIAAQIGRSGKEGE